MFLYDVIHEKVCGNAQSVDLSIIYLQYTHIININAQLMSVRTEGSKDCLFGVKLQPLFRKSVEDFVPLANEDI